MTKYDFTTLPDRTGKGQRKYIVMKEINPDVPENTVPLTVADMDLLPVPEIAQGLKDYIDNGAVFGYSIDYPEYRSAVKNWFESRFNYNIKDKWLVYTPGVVNAFTAALRALVEPGAGVILMKPIYFPMHHAIHTSGLKEVNVPLIENNMEYSIDFDAFEEAAKDSNNQALLLCSPHNPVGRVWTREELERIGEICVENDIIIISDEIWMDLIPGDIPHTMISSISKDIENLTITATAPSKTFNLAGLATSNILVPNPDFREKLEEELQNMRSTSINTMGWKACELAYTYGEPWLEGMLELLKTNEKITKDFFNEYGIKTSPLEGTYVLWVDFRSLGLPDEEIYKIFEQEYNFFVNHGYVFGDEGKGMARINIALPSEKLMEELEKIRPFLQSYSKS